MKYYAIADLAGQYKGLLALVEQLPEDANIILLGDEMDRGPQSKEVVQWIIDNQSRVQTILSNHSNMFLDYFTNNTDHYGGGCWLMNGGQTTLESYEGKVPQEHLDFLSSRPSKIELEINTKKLWLSHAFPTKEWVDACEANEPEPELFSREMEDRLWNRNHPKKHNRYDIAICGHNSHLGYRVWSDADEPYGICIDASRSNVLTAIDLCTLQIIQQPYI